FAGHFPVTDHIFRLTPLCTPRLKQPNAGSGRHPMRRLILIVVSLVIVAGALHAQSSGTISLQERVTTASQIYHIVSTFFPGLSQHKFDASYQQYLTIALRTEDRREFDLASMAFVAELHDAHSWFYDRWLDRNYPGSTGFLAYPLGGKWTVVHSEI